MKAFVATVHILIDPRIVGPDAKTGWDTEAHMSEEMSAILSDNPDILDWAYADVIDADGFRSIEPFTAIEIDPNDYEEGEFLRQVEGLTA